MALTSQAQRYESLKSVWPHDLGAQKSVFQKPALDQIFSLVHILRICASVWSQDGNCDVVQ
jgi:hypothetical protein